MTSQVTASPRFEGRLEEPSARGEVALLGPQGEEPTLVRVLAETGITGPVAAVASGWEERENEVEELGSLGDRVRNLQLFHRAERLYRKVPDLDDLRQEHLRRRRQVRRLYGVRLQQVFDTWQALGLRREEQALVQDQRVSLLAELRRLDAEHLDRIDRLIAEYAAVLMDRFEDPVQRQRAEVAREAVDCAVVVVAGGNVSTLQETLELFELGALLPGKLVVGWSAGAMVLTDRVVLYHDHPPQGVGNPEVLCRGLGVARALVALPHARARLDLHVVDRAARLATRFQPATCVTLDAGAVVRSLAGGGWLAERAEVVGLDGTLREASW